MPESLGPSPVFLTGLVPGRCALVGADGARRGHYLPAYLRRFPFILGEAGEAPPLVCRDDTSEMTRREPNAHEPARMDPT